MSTSAAVSVPSPLSPGSQGFGGLWKRVRLILILVLICALLVPVLTTRVLMAAAAPNFSVTVTTLVFNTTVSCFDLGGDNFRVDMKLGFGKTTSSNSEDGYGSCGNWENIQDEVGEVIFKCVEELDLPEWLSDPIYTFINNIVKMLISGIPPTAP